MYSNTQQALMRLPSWITKRLPESNLAQRGPPRSCFELGGGSWQEIQRFFSPPTLLPLQVTAVAVPPEDGLLLQAGTEPESQGALQDPTKLPPHFPDEAAGQGETVPDGLPNSLEGEEEGEEGCRDWALSGSAGQIASAIRALGVDLLREIETEKGTDNIIFSPLSIALALTHLSLGNTARKTLLGGGRLTPPRLLGSAPQERASCRDAAVLLLLPLIPAASFALLSSSCH